MHIPDGYLSPATCAAFYAASAPFWYVALDRVKKALHTRLIPRLSLFAAFSFVIMMFNLPLPGGTTGHAVGIGLAAVVLGPWAAMLAVSVAIVVQALFFGDGGITAIGANCFNMAIAGALVAYGVYRLIAGRSALTSSRRVAAAGIAGYCAVNVSALLAALEFGIQPLLYRDASGAPLYCPYPLSVAIPAMMIGHLTIAGVAEAFVSAGVVAFLQKSDATILAATAPRAEKTPAAKTAGATNGWDAGDTCGLEAVTRGLDGAATRRLDGVTDGLAADAANGFDAGPTNGRHGGDPKPSPALRPLWALLAVLLVLTPLGILAAGSAWGEWMASDYSNPAARGQMAATSFAQAPPARAPEGLARLSTVWTAPFARYAPPSVRNAGFGYMLSAMFGAGLIVLICMAARW